MEYSEGNIEEKFPEEKLDGMSLKHGDAEDVINESSGVSELGFGNSEPQIVSGDVNHIECQIHEAESSLPSKGSDDKVTTTDNEAEESMTRKEATAITAESCDAYADDFVTNKQTPEKRLPNSVLPLLRYYHYESSESSSR